MIYELIMRIAYVGIGEVIGLLIVMYLCWIYDRIKNDEIYKYRGGKE